MLPAKGTAALVGVKLFLHLAAQQMNFHSLLGASNDNFSQTTERRESAEKRFCRERTEF
jgi:hypothetical protein